MPLGTEKHGGQVKVYLAGGMKTDWRSEVVAKGPSEAHYADPCCHGLPTEREYTAWDLLAIDWSDVVFVYFEASNPSGYGLCLEAGYAHAKGKTVVVVDEKSAADPVTGKRLGMLRSIADVVLTNLDDGVEILNRLARIPWQ